VRGSGELTVTAAGDREIALTRAFAAPRDLVFQAWTRPDLLRRWFGPHGHRLVVCEVDLRVGGAWHFVLEEPDGKRMRLHGIYREIVRPERLVYTERSECEAQVGSESLVTVTLVEHEGGTTVTSTVRFESPRIRDDLLDSGMRRGIAEGYERLDAALSTPDDAALAARRDLVVTRVFDAPLARVWHAWSDPAQVRQWWGPVGFTCPRAEISFHPGGTSLVSMHSPDFGVRHSTWHYTEIVPMRRIEYVHNLADRDGRRLDPVEVGMPPDFPQDQRHTVVFRALDEGRTELTITEYGWPVGQLMEFSRIGMEQCLDKMAASLAGA
jgi:uncharacterized protein YndB with AHSA1/START domain